MFSIIDSIRLVDREYEWADLLNQDEPVSQGKHADGDQDGDTEGHNPG
jgi:hypothetical protein